MAFLQAIKKEIMTWFKDYNDVPVETGENFVVTSSLPFSVNTTGESVKSLFTCGISGSIDYSNMSTDEPYEMRIFGREEIDFDKIKTVNKSPDGLCDYSSLFDRISKKLYFTCALLLPDLPRLLFERLRYNGSFDFSHSYDPSVFFNKLRCELLMSPPNFSEVRSNIASINCDIEKWNNSEFFGVKSDDVARTASILNMHAGNIAKNLNVLFFDSSVEPVTINRMKVVNPSFDASEKIRYRPMNF